MSYTTLLPKQCPQCKSDFLPKPWQRPGSWKNQKYCSVKCARTIPWNKDTVGEQVAWNKGKPMTWLKGDKHPLWKGDNVGNIGLHNWVRRQLKYTGVCEFCGAKPKVSKIDGRRRIHLANKSHAYKRDLSDWFWLCIPCHKRYDLNRKK